MRYFEAILKDIHSWTHTASHKLVEYRGVHIVATVFTAVSGRKINERETAACKHPDIYSYIFKPMPFTDTPELLSHYNDFFAGTVTLAEACLGTS